MHGKGSCKQCPDSLDLNPTEDRNYRNNPPIMIRYAADTNERPKYILIDAGKTFREGAVRWFRRLEIPGVDAVILTHEHADACWGLDDMRSAQLQRPLTVYLSNQTFTALQGVYPYLMPKSNSKPSTAFVAQLNWEVIPQDASTLFDVFGLKVAPIPVYHGENYLSLGYAFGLDSKKFVYLSDVSSVPEESMKVMKQYEQIEYLVIDCLAWKSNCPTHLNFDQALALVRELKPKHALLTGVCHDAFQPRSGQREATGDARRGGAGCAAAVRV